MYGAIHFYRTYKTSCFFVFVFIKIKVVWNSLGRRGQVDRKEERGEFVLPYEHIYEMCEGLNVLISHDSRQSMRSTVLEEQWREFQHLII